MKTFRNIIDFFQIGVWASAVYLLWCDPRANSLWVMILLSAPVIVIIAMVLSVMPKAREHRMFGSGDPSTARDIMGSARRYTLHRWAAAACDLVGGGYMVYAGSGLAGCGEVLIVMTILRRFFNWLDTTGSGRWLAKRVGLPTTPNKDLDYPMERAYAPMGRS